MKKVVKFLLISLLALLTSFCSFYITKKYILKENVKLEQKKEKDVKKEEKPKEVYPKNYKLSMIMTGDALIHTTVYKDAYIGDGNYDFTKQMTYIEPIIKNYDLAFYNQETIIGGKDLGMSSYPLFNSPDEIGDCMVNMGFNLVNLASNHSLDKGERGILHSLNYWKNKENVLTAGSYESEEDRITPRIMEKNNIKYTLLSYTTSINGLLHPDGKNYYTVTYSDEKVKEDIERVKDKVDVILVSMHWGNEYQQSASEEQKRVARYLSSLGVNIIIGTHPHVLEPIEYINDTLVIYSLGNFISAQIGIERLTGALVSIDINKTVNEDKTSTITLSNLNTELIYTYYRNWSNYKVIPYKQLTDNELPNYRTHYEKYSNIIRMYDESIPITSLEG